MSGPSAKLEQKERRELAGSTTTTTYFHQSQIAETLDAPGGRYREKETITGSELVPQYPRLPASSPWAGDLVGLEQPLGVSVDDHEATGTHAEVEASLAQVAAPAFPGSQTTEASSPSVAERKAPPLLSPGSGGALSTSHERLAEILPRLARPTFRKRKI
jgi:hypothetical protein